MLLLRNSRKVHVTSLLIFAVAKFAIDLVPFAHFQHELHGFPFKRKNKNAQWKPRELKTIFKKLCCFLASGFIMKPACYPSPPLRPLEVRVLHQSPHPFSLILAKETPPGNTQAVLNCGLLLLLVPRSWLSEMSCSCPWRFHLGVVLVTEKSTICSGSSEYLDSCKIFA